MQPDGTPARPGAPRTVTRREALLLGGAGVASLALAACSSDSTTGTSGTTAGTTAGTSGTTAGSTAGTTGVVTMDDALRAQLDAVLAEGVAGTGVPGAAAGVWIAGEPWRGTAGVADLTTGDPYPADAFARIASITKTFTGTAVLLRVDAGDLALDDVLETYIPGIANGTEITIEQMLGMRSGIFDFTSDQAFLAEFDADPTMAWTPEQTIEIIKANPPAFAPGTAVQYCDSNYVLLGLIVEQLTGTTLGEAISTGILEPLGMSGTSYPTTAAMPEPHPTAYLPDLSAADPEHPLPFDNAAHPPTVVNEVNPAVSAGAGAMISTVEDLDVWARELGTGTLLAAETQRKRLASELMTGQSVAGYGLGLLTIGELVGHNGAIIGYSAFAMYDPAIDATFVVVSNESTNFTTPATDIGIALARTVRPSALGG